MVHHGGERAHGLWGFLFLHLQWLLLWRSKGEVDRPATQLGGGALHSPQTKMSGAWQFRRRWRSPCGRWLEEYHSGGSRVSLGLVSKLCERIAHGAEKESSSTHRRNATGPPVIYAQVKGATRGFQDESLVQQVVHEVFKMTSTMETSEESAHVRWISRQIGLKGTDVRILVPVEGSDLREVLAPYPAFRWLWRNIAAWQWGSKQHTNVLEVAAFLAELQRRVRDPKGLKQRYLHVIGSLVTYFAVTKGRSNSIRLNHLLRRTMAVQISSRAVPLLTWTLSKWKPSDEATQCFGGNAELTYASARSGGSSGWRQWMPSNSQQRNRFGSVEFQKKKFYNRGRRVRMRETLIRPFQDGKSSCNGVRYLEWFPAQPAIDQKEIGCFTAVLFPATGGARALEPWQSGSENSGDPIKSGGHNWCLSKGRGQMLTITKALAQLDVPSPMSKGLKKFHSRGKTLGIETSSRFVRWKKVLAHLECARFRVETDSKSFTTLPATCGEKGLKGQWKTNWPTRMNEASSEIVLLWAFLRPQNRGRKWFKPSLRPSLTTPLVLSLTGCNPERPWPRYSNAWLLDVQPSTLMLYDPWKDNATHAYVSSCSGREGVYKRFLSLSQKFWCHDTILLRESAQSWCKCTRFAPFCANNKHGDTANLWWVK